LWWPRRCDARELVDQVKNGKSATDAAPRVSGYTYTSRGETDVETKANGNTVDSDYYDPAVPKGVQIYWRSSNGDSGDPHVSNSP
jgi:hypothetical protein